MSRLASPTIAAPASSLPEPSPGQLYSFRTRPYPEVSQPSTDRFAAFKILGIEDAFIVVAVLDGIWANAPSLKEVQASSVLFENRPRPIKIAGRLRPAVFWAAQKFWAPETDLDQTKFVGKEMLTSEDQANFNRSRHIPFQTYADLYFANESAEGEWRWSHEPEAFTRDLELARARHTAARAANEERYRHRLKNLTWEQLKSETPFERWSSTSHSPPEDFIAAARTTIRNACEALEELGPKPKRPDVRAILKSTVLWFNEAEERAGGVIETEERGEIFGALEEMSYIARQKNLVHEIDLWREW